MISPSEFVTREHHFVPQFYLRRFSSDGKRINLFNFSLQRAIVGASIKHQCSRRNFYGFAPELEGALSTLEGVTAAITRDILSKKKMPPPSSTEWLALLGFIVYQKLRTTNAGYENDAMTDYFAKTLLRGDPELRDVDLDTFVVHNRYSIALPLKLAEKVIPIASDLRGHLLINETEHEFATSDDPIVSHNQYCEGISYRGVNGWDCSGLQVFWPISPAALLLWYDSAVYKVGMSHRGRNETVITAESDVRQLNSLQILNASQNIYFANGDNKDSIEEHCRSLLKRRPRGRVKFVETEVVAQEDGRQSAILAAFRPLLPIKLALSPIKVRTKARQIPLDKRSMLMRHSLERRPPSTAARVSESVLYPVKSVTLK